MDIDDFVKGVVSSLLTNLVGEKTSLAYKVGWISFASCLAGAVFLDGWLRALVVIVALLSLGLLVFVFLSKRLALGIINRFAPPVEIGDARVQFESAVAEADLPTGPASFLRLVWRLRKGVGPEVERLAGVVEQLRSV